MDVLTIDWKPDKSSDIAVYKQIVSYIRRKIATGEWPVKSKLPPQRTLAARFGVNRSTVVTALEELRAEGLIESNVGSGTLVSNNTWSLLAAPSPPDWLSYVKAGAHPPNLPTIQAINRHEPDPNYIRLGTGELSVDLIPTKQMKNMLSRAGDAAMQLGYTEPKGLMPLRQAISLRLRERGIEASPSSILIVSGALQALHLIAIGLLHPGSTILLEQPSYLQSFPLFQASGMHLVGVPMDEEGIVAEALAHHKRSQNGALLYTIPSYHNPTGRFMTERRREQVLAVCERERLPLLEDDVYGELWFDRQAAVPLKARDQNGLILYLGSLSKTLSPGLRIGWIVGPEPVVDRLADVKMQTDYGASALSQWVALEWLKSGAYEEHLKEVRVALRERRDFMCSLLDRWFHDLADWQMPQGGFYIWLRFRHFSSTRALFAKALTAGILLNPGYLYDQTDSRHLRLSYAYASKEEMELALFRLSVLVKEMIKH